MLAAQKKMNNKVIKSKDEGIVRSQNMNVMLEINQMQEASIAKFDADVQTVEITSIPEKFKFINNIELPSEYKLDSSYEIFTRGKILTQLNATYCMIMYLIIVKTMKIVLK